MKIRIASLLDIEQLIRLRLDFFTFSNETVDEADKAAIRTSLRSYFTRHISAGDFFAFLAENDKTIVSAAFLTIFEKPANPYYLSGITGTVFNVFTYPEYQRQGFSFQIIKALIELAKSKEILCLDLYATEQGLPFYKKLGFSKINNTAMRLQL